MAVTIKTSNPYTGKTIQEYNLSSHSSVKSTLKISNERFYQWKTTTIKDRCRLLENFSQILEDDKMNYATQITLEMGKPITQSIAEIEKCATLCDFYAANAEDFLADEQIETVIMKG